MRRRLYIGALVAFGLVAAGGAAVLLGDVAPADDRQHGQDGGAATAELVEPGQVEPGQVEPGQVELRPPKLSAREWAPSGRVLRLEVDGQPMTGPVEAVIGAAGLYPPVITQTTAGRLELPEVPAAAFGETPGQADQVYEIYASSPDGRAFWGTARFVGEADAPADKTIELEEARPARVQVTDLDGQPVAGAQVRLSRGLIGFVHLVDQTNQEGVASLGLVPAGAWSVTVDAPGFVGFSRTLLHDGRGDLVARLDRGATVFGRVVDTHGRPVPSATVEVYPVSRFASDGDDAPTAGVDAALLAQVGVASQIAAADYAGQFAVAGIGAGAVRLAARAPGYAPALSDKVRIRRGQRHGQVEIVLAEGFRVLASVIDADGRPAEAVSVYWRDPVSGLTAAATTNAEGVATLRGVPEMAVMWAEDATRRSAERSPKRSADGGGRVDLRLREVGPARTLWVRLMAPESVEVRQAELRSPDAAVVCRGEHRERQDWRFEDCPTGRYELRVETAAHGQLRLAQTFGETTEVELPDPAPLRVELVGLRGAQWHESALWWRPVGGAWTAAPLEGSFDERVAEWSVLPGPYELRFESPQTSAEQRRVEVEAATTLEWTLARQQPLEVFVVDDQGAPVHGARIEVRADGRLVEVGRSQGAQPWAVELTPPVELTVFAADGRIGEGQRQIALVAGAEAPELVVRLDFDLMQTPLPGRVVEQAAIEEVLGAPIVRDGRQWLVDVVDPDAPAARAGIARGDRLVWLRRTGEAGYRALVERGAERFEVAVE